MISTSSPEVRSSMTRRDGHRHLSFNKVAALYPRLLVEFDRVLKPGGSAVILTVARKVINRVIANQSALLRSSPEPIVVNLGASLCSSVHFI